MTTYYTVQRSPFKRLVLPVALILSILVLGSAGYYVLTDGAYSMGECAFMTAITVSTVGFDEAIPIHQDPTLRAYTVLLILTGAGSILYLLSNVTAFLVEGEFNEYIRRLRMDKDIEKLHDHYVVCGVGRNGRNAALQFVAGGFPLVLMDQSEETLKEFMATHRLSVPFVAGDAKDERALVKTGIEKAKGLIAALPEDADNIYLILSGRQMNPRIRIVAKISEERSRQKFLQVGADAVVSPTEIGGIRMYNEMMRPGVTSFLDDLMHETGEKLVMEEVVIPEGSALHGRRLAESGIRQRTNLLVVGVRGMDRGRFVYNPGPDFELGEGMTLIVLGPRDSIAELRRMAGAGA